MPSRDCFDGLCGHPDCRECNPCGGECGESVESCLCTEEVEL